MRFRNVQVRENSRAGGLNINLTYIKFRFLCWKAFSDRPTLKLRFFQQLSLTFDGGRSFPHIISLKIKNKHWKLSISWRSIRTSSWAARKRFGVETKGFGDNGRNEGLRIHIYLRSSCCYSYLQVPERIRAMNSSVKLLLIVREPVTRAISDYTQLRTHAASTATTSMMDNGIPDGEELSKAAASSASASTSAAHEPTKSFEELVIRPDGSINESYRPIAISLYHTYMHRWLEVFSRDQILVVNGDQLIEDPVPQLRRIESFLGLEPRIGRHNFYFNHTKGFYCLRNDTAEKCLRESKGRRHPRVSPVVVTKLRKFFNEHNQRFYELVGEDLGWPEE